jgi:predicted secreted hydrolase
MKSISNLLAVLAIFCLAADWQVAEPGWQYQFPRDHHWHENFKTEWWYFTGNLTNESRRRFGYELTFFRQGIRPLAERTNTTSRFIVDDLKFAHFTVTDAARKAFLFQQKANRGSFGEAGFSDQDRLAWIDSWNLKMNADGSFDLAADSTDAEVRLHLVPSKAPVVHGTGGISQKAAGTGHASHYYSSTRLETSGTVRVRKETLPVTGESWFDHEWATNQLAPGQAGWDWISAQFDDRSELMLYQMRLTSGGVDPASSGTYVRADGSSATLASTDFQMTPVTFWKSKTTSANYPIGWRISVPKEELEFTIQPVLPDQELALDPITYWEGAFDLAGTCAGKPVRGRGYLELTGYAGALGETLNR